MDELEFLKGSMSVNEVRRRAIAPVKHNPWPMLAGIVFGCVLAANLVSNFITFEVLKSIMQEQVRQGQAEVRHALGQ